MGWIKEKIKPDEYYELCRILAQNIQKIGKNYEYIYSFPRGGLVVGVYLSHYLNLPLLINLDNQIKTSKILLVDDLVDTGKTLKPYCNRYDTAVLFYKPRSEVLPTYYAKLCENNIWLIFPYEKEDEQPNREVLYDPVYDTYK